MDAVSVCAESEYVCARRSGTARRNFSRCCLTMPGCVDGPLGRREVEQQSDSAVAQAKSAVTTRHTTPRPETMTAHKSKVTGERTREREIKRNVLCTAWAFINPRKTPEDNFISSVYSSGDLIQVSFVLNVIQSLKFLSKVKIETIEKIIGIK